MQLADKQIFQRAINALRTGALEEAERGLGEFLRRNPEHVGALNLYGLLLTQKQRFEEAEPVMRRAIALDARSDATFYNYGIVLKALNWAQPAYEAFSKAIAINPSVPEGWNNRGTVLNDLKRYREAIADFQKAIALNPRYAEAYYNMGRSFAELKQHAQALAAYDAAVGLKPDFADAYCNRGGTLLELRRREEALASYQRSLVLKPDHPEALHGCGALYFALGKHAEALAALERAYALKPDMKFLAGRRLLAKRFLCDWSNFDRDFADLVAGIRSGRSAAAPFDMLAVSSSAKDHLQCAQLFVREELPDHAVRLWQGERFVNERVRLAYLSGDFQHHATAELMAELFELHDRSRFEVIGVSFGPDDDSAMRKRLVGAFDEFIDVRTESDEDIARMLHRRRVDIAVDLKGNTQDSRPGIFAFRPAPVQVNYLGYPGTMGVEDMDYVIADPVILPFDQQPYYIEKIVQLPGSYQVNDRKRQIAPDTPAREDVGLPADGFVFCCFNLSYKIAPATFSVWMRLLAAIEGSVLWLLCDNVLTAENLRKETKARGIAPERLVLADRLPLAQHLARHRLADLFLDTLPYNAHTTASEALWSGLPVLTCEGETFAGRVAASLLHAAGLPELVTTNSADYEALALKLAGDPGLLRDIRAKLARNRDTCALFDTKRFARHIEAAYRAMWEMWQRGEAPKSFRVEPIT